MSVPPEQMVARYGVGPEDPTETGDEASAAVSKLLGWAEQDNLIDQFDRKDLDQLKADLSDQYGQDLNTMKGWSKKYDKAFTLAKMKVSEEKKTKPFEGAAKVMMPYVIEAAIDFNARMIPDTIASKTPVKAEVFGRETDEKEARADRVAEFSNYLLSTNKFWKRDTDQEFMALPIVGTSYKKTYYCPLSKRFESRMVKADEIIFSHEAPTFEEAPLITHNVKYTKNDVAAHMSADLWEMKDRERLDDEKTEYDFREYHLWYDLDEDGYQEPYIATYCEETDEIVRVVARYDEEGINELNGEIVCIEADDYFTQKVLIPDPEGKPYGLGWGILLHDIYDSINTNTRMLIDAGALANSASNTGFIAASLSPQLNQPGRMQEGALDMEMGKYKTIQVANGGSFKDSVVQMPFAGPQPVLFQLMQHLEEGARRMSLASFHVESNAGEAATLYLARLQQALKVPNAMIWRVYEGLTEEFRKLHKLIYKYGDDEEYNRVLDDVEVQKDERGNTVGEKPVQRSLREDFNYEDCDIVPTADPTQGSEMERMMKAQVLTDMMALPYAQQVLDPREVVERQLKAASEPNIEVLMPPPPPPQPDPMIEQQKAFMAMEAEFRNREMGIKEQELQLKQLKIMQDAQREAAKLGIDTRLGEADVAKKTAEVLRIIAETSALGVETDLARLQSAENTITNQ